MTKKTTKVQGGVQTKIVKSLFTTTKLTILLILLVLAGGVWSWWHYLYTPADKVFWGMMEANLATSSYSKRSIQDDGQQVTKQEIEVQTAPSHLVNTRTTITQKDNEKTEVVTENVGTPDADYIRYINIQTAQKGKSGKDLDFSQVLGIWGKTEQSEDATSGQVYNETVLGVLPIGNMQPATRRQMLSEMKQTSAYTYNLRQIEKSGTLKRPTYVYEVQINPVQYITILKSFAMKTGLHQFDDVDPQQYEQVNPVTVIMKVDVWSRQLQSVTYLNGRQETFVAHNSKKQLQLAPSDAIPVQELQRKLQTIQ